MSGRQGRAERRPGTRGGPGERHGLSVGLCGKAAPEVILLSMIDVLSAPSRYRQLEALNSVGNDYVNQFMAAYQFP